MDQVFKTDSDLNAFLVDYFLDVKRQIDTGTPRDQKITILFERVSERAVFDALQASFPEALARFMAKRATEPAAPVGDVVDRGKLHAVLSQMLESQFQQVVFYCGADRAHLMGQNAPLSQQATQLILLCEQRMGGLEQLVAAIRKVAPGLL